MYNFCCCAQKIQGVFRATFLSFHLFWHGFYLFVTAIEIPWQELAVRVTRGCWRLLPESQQLLGLIQAALGSLVLRAGQGRGGGGERVIAKEMEGKKRVQQEAVRLEGFFPITGFFWGEIPLRTCMSRHKN